MKKLLLFAVVLSSIMLGACTNDEDTKNEPGSIYGIVTELGTAEPMKAVGVELYKRYDTTFTLLLKTVTFDDGHFEFKDLNPTKYQVKVVADGYEQTEKYVTVEAGRQARIDLQVKKVDPGMTLTTYDVENITSTGATFKGKYHYLNYSPSECGFVYSKETNTSGGTVVKSIDIEYIEIYTYEFTATVNNLSSGTYYVKAYAKNSDGTVYGDVREFEITGYPMVSTLAASNISETAATLNGHIDYVGDPAYTERGFVYSSTFANPTVEDSESATTKVKVSGSGEDFSANVAGLTKNKTYYVRAYVSNSKGTWYGESVSFSTDMTPYVVVDGLAVQKQDLGTAGYGAAWNMCEGSRVGGFSDWRLPTVGELAILYTHRNEIGGFKSGLYWADRGNSSDYYFYNFSTGTQGSFYYSYYSNHDRNYYVRAVRTAK